MKRIQLFVRLIVSWTNSWVNVRIFWSTAATNSSNGITRNETSNKVRWSSTTTDQFGFSNLNHYSPSVGEKPESTIAKYNFSRTASNGLCLSDTGLRMNIMTIDSLIFLYRVLSLTIPCVELNLAILINDFIRKLLWSCWNWIQTMSSKWIEGEVITVAWTNSRAISSLRTFPHSAYFCLSVSARMIFW